MSMHKRRHHRARKAAHRAYEVATQLARNPQFMKRAKGKEGHERRAELQRRLDARLGVRWASDMSKAEAEKAQAAARLLRPDPISTYVGVKTHVPVSTISTPPTTRQVKKGPSRSEKAREERRMARRAKKPSAT